MRRDRLTPVASPGEHGHRATALAAVLMLLIAEGVAAQSPLQQAVESARLAWLQHDFSGLVESSDTVRLQFPEGGRAPSVRPAHAARVLEEYLVSANEIAFELRNIREASDDHAYAELWFSAPPTSGSRRCSWGSVESMAAGSSARSALPRRVSWITTIRKSSLASNLAPFYIYKLELNPLVWSRV